jgi:hypothetical protein
VLSRCTRREFLLSGGKNEPHPLQTDGEPI